MLFNFSEIRNVYKYKHIYVNNAPINNSRHWHIDLVYSKKFAQLIKSANTYIRPVNFFWHFDQWVQYRYLRKDGQSHHFVYWWRWCELVASTVTFISENWQWTAFFVGSNNLSTVCWFSMRSTSIMLNAIDAHQRCLHQETSKGLWKLFALEVKTLLFTEFLKKNFISTIWPLSWTHENKADRRTKGQTDKQAIDKIEVGSICKCLWYIVGEVSGWLPLSLSWIWVFAFNPYI